MLAMIFVMRFLAKGLGPEEFGAYSLARRIISNLAPIALISMNIALARFIAMTSESRQQGSYIISSLILTVTSLAVLFLFAISASQKLSYLVFHSYDHLNLYYASFLLLAGYCIFIITYAYFRGVQNFNVANSLQIIFMAVIPLTISYAYASRKNSSFIVFFIGLGFFLSVIPLIFVLIKTKLPGLSDIKSSLTSLFKYGFPRVPAGFAFAGLLTLGPFLSGHFIGLKEAGYFVVGQSVFRIMESVLVGFGLVALPKVSQMLAGTEKKSLSYKIEDVLIMIFQVGLFITIHTFLWSKDIVLVWLGSDYIEAVPIMRIIILSLGPYLGYVILRSIVDAVEVKAINSWNLILSLVFAAIISILSISLGFGIIGLAICTTLGFAFLGVSTSGFLMRRFHISFKNSLFPWILILNIMFAGIIIIFKQYMISSLSLYQSLFYGIIIEGGLFSSYLIFLYKKNVRWISELKKRMFS